MIYLQNNQHTKLILMKLLQLIFIFLLFLTYSMSVCWAESGVLYLWQISPVNVWEGYGDENVQQKYEGITLNGKPAGKGVLFFPDGRSVTGEWKDGKEWNTKHFSNDGKLIKRYIKGKYVIGAGEKIEMVMFLRKVSGRWVWREDGDDGKDYKYEGTIENGKPNGSGTYTSPSGNQYIGEFKDGKKHGQGTFTYTSGSKYQGEFKDGKKHGQGTFSWKNGAKRVGEFRKGKVWNITGFGKNGNILKKWVNGVMVFDKKKEKLLFLRNENGKWIWLESGNEESDGKYVGSIDKNGIPGGAGTLSLPDGN